MLQSVLYDNQSVLYFMLTLLSADDLVKIFDQSQSVYVDAQILVIMLQRMIWQLQRVAHVINLLMLTYYLSSDASDVDTDLLMLIPSELL